MIRDIRPINIDASPYRQRTPRDREIEIADQLDQGKMPWMTGGFAVVFDHRPYRWEANITSTTSAISPTTKICLGTVRLQIW
ncbi:MAG TPA: hypothetical protein VLH84_01320 [Patescibacteria group bacterium]|nr:hypothetical protein [Patescibacteria group bacterium]